jgi:endonuclease YncB( thermonuclease family)
LHLRKPLHPLSRSSDSTAAPISRSGGTTGIRSTSSLSDQKELIFRLYFVDTPEEERVYADRITEQAAYFGITPDAVIQIGRQASEFTKQALTKRFTIYTRWRRALGRGAIWRYYAIVVTADGSDLNELLVSAGLARIYGTRTPLSDCVLALDLTNSTLVTHLSLKRFAFVTQKLDAL